MRMFSVRVVSTGCDPLGGFISESHAFFTGPFTFHESGKNYMDLEVGEGECVRRARSGNPPILYTVTRIQ